MCGTSWFILSIQSPRKDCIMNYPSFSGPDDVEMSDDEADGSSPRLVDSRLDDARKLLVVTHNEKAEMWHVDYVGKKYGNKPLKAEEVETGCLKVGWRYLH